MQEKDAAICQQLPATVVVFCSTTEQPRICFIQFKVQMSIPGRGKCSLRTIAVDAWVKFSLFIHWLFPRAFVALGNSQWIKSGYFTLASIAMVLSEQYRFFLYWV